MSPIPAAQAIRTRNNAFEEAFARHDARALVEDYFVADTLVPSAYPPGGIAPVHGRDNLVAMFNKQFESLQTIKLLTYRLVENGDQAFEVGRALLTDTEGEASVGRYAVCWLKTKDGWRANVDFFAADGWQKQCHQSTTHYPPLVST